MDSQDQDHSGYIQNVKDINSSSFSFDLQAEQSSKRFVCFSPEKKRDIEGKITSPVKIKRAKLTQKDLIFEPTSEMEDTELDYQPINMKEIKVKTLHMVANNSLLDIDVQVMEKVEDKLVKGKKVRTYSVGDGSGSCKFTVWENAGGDITVGSSYKLKNCRVLKDVYGSFGLQTPMKGFSMEKLETPIKGVATKSAFSGELKTKVGEIMFVESVSRYKTCVNPKCRKRLPQTAQKSVQCSHCNGVNKIRFCSTGMFARIIFVEGENKKSTLTMFQDTITKLLPEADKLTDEDLKKKLMEDFDELKVTLGHKGDTINDVEVVQDE